MAFDSHQERMSSSLLGGSGSGSGGSPRQAASECIRTIVTCTSRLAESTRTAAAANPFSGAAAAKQAIVQGRRVLSEARECRLRMQSASSLMGSSSAEQKLQREWRVQWDRFTNAKEEFAQADDKLGGGGGGASSRAAASGARGGGYGASGEGIALVTESQQQSRPVQPQEQQIRFASFGDIGELIDRESTLEYVDLATEAAALKETFQDLNQLTKEQNEPLSEIAGKMEDAAVASGAGSKSLVSAAKNKGKTRKKVCILIAILSVVATIILIIILYETGVLSDIVDAIKDDINKKKKKRLR